MENITSAGFDSPRESDYLWEELELGMGELPKKTSNRTKGSTPLQNQFLEEFTWNACGSYSNSHAINILNGIEGTYGLSPKTTTTGKDLWERQCKPPYRGSVTGGSWLQDNVDQSRHEGLSGGNVICRTIESMKTALARGWIIETGSDKINWQAIGSDGLVTDVGGGAAHLFPIVDYDDDLHGGCWITKQSNGEHAFNGGYVYIPYKYTDKLYTRYAILDMDNKDLIDKVAADRKLLNEAKDQGIWNGERENDPATRGEVVLMIKRSLQLLNKQI